MTPLLRVAIGVGLAIYIFLWVIAFAGARQLIAVLATPLILVLLIALGNWLRATIEGDVRGRGPRDQ